MSARYDYTDDLGLFGPPVEAIDTDDTSDDHDEDKIGESITNRAAHYARNRLRVFPVDMRVNSDGKRPKEPAKHYLWKARATTVVREVVEDFTEAVGNWGEEGVGVAWALGLDGYFALDLDIDEEPDWWAEARVSAAVNVTARGHHLVCRNPDDLVPSNSTGNFPTNEWGEARGHGGYIVIDAIDRPGLNVDDLPGLSPFGHPEWLTAEGDIATAASSASVDKFIAEHDESISAGALKGVRTYLDNWKPGAERPNGKRYDASRHNTARDAACWIARDAAAGLYPAADGFNVLRAWWATKMTTEPGRIKNRELPSAIAWAIGQAESDPDRVASMRAEALVRVDQTSTTDNADDTSTGKAPPARDTVVDLAAEHYAICRLEDERTFLVPHDGPNIALLSGSAKAHLARRYRAETGKTIGRSPLDEAWLTIEGLAHDAAKVTLPLRVGASENGSPVIDLGDTEGRAIVVSTDGWAVVDRSPITFRRSKAMMPLDEPLRGGHIDEMFTLLNVDESNRSLFAAWLTSSLFEGLPHPAPVLRGEQGAAKSSTARAMTQLVDPCMAATQKPPKTDDDWAQTCSARWMVAVDNVSNVSEWWSDALCRTVTGDGWLRRALYTDDDVVATTWRRCVILNGITLGATLRPDLAERLVMFELRRPTEWLTEGEVEARLNEMRPRVLGALLDSAVEVLKVRPYVDIVRDLRMADFATFLAAYDRTTGATSLASYRDQLDNVFDEALESDAVATAVIELMDKHAEWTGTARQLLAELVEPLGGLPAEWPANARQMTNSMSRSSAMLRKVGIDWTQGRRVKAGRLNTIRRVESEGAVGVVGAQDSPLLCLDVEKEERAA